MTKFSIYQSLRVEHLSIQSGWTGSPGRAWYETIRLFEGGQKWLGTPRSLRIAWLFIAVILACTVSGCQPVNNAGEVPEPTVETDDGGPFAPYVVEGAGGQKYSLNDGRYLVAMLSMNCDHCMAAVPRLNEYQDFAQDVPVVALCFEPEEGAFKEFAALTSPRFPMHSLGDDFMAFSELIGSAPPRLSLVEDGVAVHSWDDTMPQLEELLDAVAAIDSGGA